MNECGGGDNINYFSYGRFYFEVVGSSVVIVDDLQPKLPFYIMGDNPKFRMTGYSGSFNIKLLITSDFN